jgi:endonuclease III
VKLLNILEREYPNPKYALDWETPVQLLVATILAAQSTDEKVNEITPNLFARWPDAHAFARADVTVLEQAITPCGLAKQKAKWIVGACAQLVEKHGGDVPRDLDELIQLPGIGRKSANVVLNTAFNIASGIIVDTHVHRVSRRLGLSSEDKPDAIEQDLMRIVPRDKWTAFGPALVLHGRHVCKAKAPACTGCALFDSCERIGVSG